MKIKRWKIEDRVFSVLMLLTLVSGPLCFAFGLNFYIAVVVSLGWLFVGLLCLAISLAIDAFSE